MYSRHLVDTPVVQSTPGATLNCNNESFCVESEMKNESLVIFGTRVLVMINVLIITIIVIPNLGMVI